MLPPIPKAGTKAWDLKNIIHASPPTPPWGCHAGEAAHLDCALVRTSERNDWTAGTALEGEFLVWLSVGLADLSCRPPCHSYTCPFCITINLWCKAPDAACVCQMVHTILDSWSPHRLVHTDTVNPSTLSICASYWGKQNCLELPSSAEIWVDKGSYVDNG